MVTTPGIRIYCSYGGIIPAGDRALEDSSQDKRIDVQGLGQACDAVSQVSVDFIVYHSNIIGLEPVITMYY